MDHAVLDEEDVCTGRLGHIAAIVEHHRVGVACTLRRMLGEGADHVEPGGLGFGRRRVRGGSRIGRMHHADAAALGLRIEIARPFPGGDGHVRLRGLRGDAHLLGTPPSDRANIGVGKSHAGDGLDAGRVDLFDREGDLHLEDLSRAEQAACVLGQLEDLAVVETFALEHAGSIVQAVGQYVHLRVAPGDEVTVHPDPTVAIVEGNDSHRAKSVDNEPCRLF